MCKCNCSSCRQQDKDTGKVHVHDVQATIVHCLGIDHTWLTYRHLGRDFRLTDVGGKRIDQILA